MGCAAVAWMSSRAASGSTDSCAAAAKSLAAAQGHQTESRQSIGTFVAVRERGSHFAQRAIAARGNHGVDAFCDRLGDVALCVAVLPGHPDAQSHTAFTHRRRLPRGAGRCRPICR